MSERGRFLCRLLGWERIESSTERFLRAVGVGRRLAGVWLFLENSFRCIGGRFGIEHCSAWSDTVSLAHYAWRLC